MRSEITIEERRTNTQLRENPPREWVNLRNGDNLNENKEYAHAYSTFISRFYWRDKENGKGDLHIVMHKENDDNPRYLYEDVPKEVYDELWMRSFRPEDYPNNIGQWYGKNIKNKYECERYQN